jgi:hypothetical protein
MSARTHAQLAASISLDRDHLADLLLDAGRDYDRLLEKLDAQAAFIAEKMARLRASIARSRETDPSTLSVNGLGELQANGPELDRLCGQVEAQRSLVRRLNEVLLPRPSTPKQPESTKEASPDPAEQEVGRQLDAQLARALDALGYDEDRGDWWSVTYDGGDSWGVKSVINGRDRNFDVTTTGYTFT